MHAWGSEEEKERRIASVVEYEKRQVRDSIMIGRLNVKKVLLMCKCSEQLLLLLKKFSPYCIHVKVSL